MKKTKPYGKLKIVIKTYNVDAIRTSQTFSDIFTQIGEDVWKGTDTTSGES